MCGAGCCAKLRLRRTHSSRGKAGIRIRHYVPARARSDQYASLSEVERLRRYKATRAWRIRPRVMASHSKHLIKVCNPRRDKKIYTPISASRYLIAQLSHCCLDVPALPVPTAGDQGVTGTQPGYAQLASADPIALRLLIPLSRRTLSSR